MNLYDACYIFSETNDTAWLTKAVCCIYLHQQPPRCNFSATYAFMAKFPLRSGAVSAPRVTLQWCHMGVVASQIKTLCSAAYPGGHQKNIKLPHQWPFVGRIGLWPTDFPQRRPIMGTCFLSWRNHVDGQGHRNVYTKMHLCSYWGSKLFWNVYSWCWNCNIPV